MHDSDNGEELEGLDLEALARSIGEAPDLEAAGRALLVPVLDLAERGLAQARGPEARGKLLRAALHLRGDEGYRGLVLVDGPGSSARRSGLGSIEASSTAWAWVRRLDQAISVDVQLGELYQVGAPGSGALHMPGSNGISAESQEVLMFRGATHVLALPARAEGSVQGMLTIELQARRAAGAPVQSWTRLAPLLQQALDVVYPRILAAGSQPVVERASDAGLPVVGRAMSGLVRLLRMAARFDDTILLMGPPGVGKSHLARLIHRWSARADRPFEEVHLQNYPETLVEGELFGWKKGAHDSADRDRVGHVARAQGGTLFLDEIDKIPRSVQQKLLYLLESRRYRVLGDSGRERQADVRFVVGTNVDLDAEVEAGRFLPDLLWRICTVPVQVLPLARRRDEIRGWAELFLRRKHQREVGSDQVSLSEAAVALLEAADWPGNLRQLDQVMTRAWLVASGAGSRGALLVDSTSVQTALDFEPSASAPGLDAALRLAAEAFRAELERRREGSPLSPLDLESASAFRGYVLAELERAYGLDGAFRALGLGHRVDSRNHHATYKRELARIDSLWQREPEDG